MKRLICAVTVLAVSTAHAGPGACGDPASGSCCIGNGTPGCDDTDCCQAICAADPFCCDIEWDDICASGTCALCDGICGCELCTNPLECPPGAVIEPEPCGGDVNGGCNSDPPIFIDAADGGTFCGTSWSDDGMRDTDWYLVDHPGGTLSATLTSMFNGLCFIVDGIATCMPAVVGDIGCSEDSEALSVASATLPPGEYVVFVAAGNCAGSGIFGGFPCDSGCNDYVVEIVSDCLCAGDDDCPPDHTCQDCQCMPCLEVIDQQLVCHGDGTTFTFTVEGVGACTGGTSMFTFTASGGAVGEEMCFTVLVDDGGFCCSTEICVTVPNCRDLNGDYIVSLIDFLILLANWGPCLDCNSCPADFDGDCSVGILDMLILLANWG